MSNDQKYGKEGGLREIKERRQFRKRRSLTRSEGRIFRVEEDGAGIKGSVSFVTRDPCV